MPTSNVTPARLTTVMAVCCALAVSTIYYHQPLLPLMAASFGLTAPQAGLIATLTQLGYGTGLLLIVPLADCRQPRLRTPRDPRHVGGRSAMTAGRSGRGPVLPRALSASALSTSRCTQSASRSLITA